MSFSVLLGEWDEVQFLTSSVFKDGWMVMLRHIWVFKIKFNIFRTFYTKSLYAGILLVTSYVKQPLMLSSSWSLKISCAPSRFEMLKSSWKWLSTFRSQESGSGWFSRTRRYRSTDPVGDPFQSIFRLTLQRFDYLMFWLDSVVITIIIVLIK